jgi:membrane protease YdiL (CAAX protease family)
VLFWLLLLAAFTVLGSGEPRRELVGLFETCAFLTLAISSTGRLKTLGLEFIAWERITRNAAAICALSGLAAGGAVTIIAKRSRQPLGVDRRWNKAVLAIFLGPVLEELIFRGYLISLALRLTRRFAHTSASAVFGALHGCALCGGAPRHGWYHDAPTGLYCDHRMFVRMDPGTV